MRTRIVFIHEFAHSKGGSSASMLDLVNMLSQDEPVLVVTPTSSEMDTAVTVAGGTHVGICSSFWQVGFGSPLTSFLNLFRLQVAIRKHLREGDVLVVNGILGEFIAGWGWMLARFPRIYFVRGAVGSSRLWRLMSLRGLRVVVAVSRYARSEFTRQFPGFKGEVVVIPNAVAIPGLTPPAPPPPPLVIGIVGFIHPQKNHELAIRALGLLRRQAIEARLDIYGDASTTDDTAYLRNLKQLITKENLEGYVTFRGRASRAEIYGGIHVLVSASLTEGFGKTIAEAMAHGLPAIALEQAGGPRDIILSDAEGILLSDAAPESLAAALQKLAGSEELRTHLGRQGREAVRLRFSPAKVATYVKNAIRAARISA